MSWNWPLLCCRNGIAFILYLTLSHSNATPERGFSVNNALLGKEKMARAANAIVAQRVVSKQFQCICTSSLP